MKNKDRKQELIEAADKYWNERYTGLRSPIENIEVSIKTEAFIIGAKSEAAKSYHSDAVDIIKSEEERLEWSIKTFEDATPYSSLQKCKGEIEEIESDLENGIKEPIEYADAIMCLFDSAGRNGISAKEIAEAYTKKVEINKARKWRKNPDNTYSHIKD